MASFCCHWLMTHSQTISEDGKHSSLKRLGKRAACYAFLFSASKKGECRRERPNLNLKPDEISFNGAIWRT